jgi:hypothetical protein
LQKYRVDGEEIAGHDGGGLGGEELAPGRTHPAWGWVEPGAFEDQEPGPRCAGPPWRRENGVAPVRDADRTVMPPELVDQDGAGGHRQELSIVAVSTRVRLLSPVAPPDGRDLVLRRLGRVRGAVA